MLGTLIRVHVLVSLANFLYVVILHILPLKCMKPLRLVCLFLYKTFLNFRLLILQTKNLGSFLLNIVEVRILLMFGMLFTWLLSKFERRMAQGDR